METSVESEETGGGRAAELQRERRIGSVESRKQPAAGILFADSTGRGAGSRRVAGSWRSGSGG